VRLQWSSARREDLIADAVPILFGAMTSIHAILPRETRRIEIISIDLDTLVDRWLTELLFVHDTENTLFRRAEATVLSLPDESLALQGHLWGEPYDPERHVIQHRLGPYVSANVVLDGGVYTATLDVGPAACPSRT
jgi:SHS2 domain-containing protein